MKKRSIKDFQALYASVDEEWLVLIQNGVAADKTFLDKFWTAHAHALAAVNLSTNEIIAKRCYLSWPLSDREYEEGEYAKRFKKGSIYRVKARDWCGSPTQDRHLYVTEVLTDRVTSPVLEQIWADYTKPVLLEDDVLGTLVLDREFSVFNGNCQWMGSSVCFSLSVDINKRGTWARAVNVMRQLVSEQVSWDASLKQMAAKELTALANDWLADDDTDRSPETDPITEDEFVRRIQLTEFYISSGGRFTAWYEDDDMFWGHVITVNASLKKGPIDAGMEG